MTPRHDPVPVRDDRPTIFASLAPGERISHAPDGGHSVLRFTPGAPGTVHIETVRRLDADRRPVAFEPDVRWAIHYRLKGHDNSFHKGRYADEAAAAAAWQALSAGRDDLVAVQD